MVAAGVVRAALAVTRRSHGRRIAAVWLVVVLLCAACGSRRSREELTAAARGAARPVTAEAANAAAPPQSAVGAASSASTTKVGNVGVTTVSGGARDASAGASAPSARSAAAAQGSGGQCTGSKTPVRIGVVGTQSGVIGSILADGPKAVQAWASAVNDRGGLGCHHVEYLIRDDGGDPSRHQALVRELVEERGVIALVQENAPLSGQASVQYLTEHGIPVIGSETGSTWFYQSPMFFPQASSGDLSSYMVIGASAVSGKAFGLHKLAVVSCIEAAACNRLYELAPDLAARNGLDLVYRVQASLVQPDYTSLCQSAKGAGAEIMLVALDSNAIERVGRSCNAVLFRPKFVIPQSAGTPQLLENPVFEGLIVGVNVMPWMVANPAIDEYRRVLGRYAPGLPVGPTSIVGWVSAKLFERAARRLSEPPTSKDILEGLWSLRNDDLDGVTYPLTFTKGQTAPVVLCYWVAQISNHSYVSPDGGQRRCASV